MVPEWRGKKTVKKHAVFLCLLVRAIWERSRGKKKVKYVAQDKTHGLESSGQLLMEHR